MARKFNRGEKIRSLDEICTQDFIWWKNKVYHKGWFRSWQFQFLFNHIYIYEDIYKIERIVKNEHTI